MFAVGAIAIWTANTYPLGNLGALGPGALPLALGLLLCVLGAGIVLESADTDFIPPTIRLRPIVFLFGSLIGFAFVLPRFGLLPATVVLVVLSSLAHHNPKPLMIVASALAMCVIGAVLFVKLLGMSLPLVAW